MHQEGLDEGIAGLVLRLPLLNRGGGFQERESPPIGHGDGVFPFLDQ
jgi:hypothetical protein